MPSPPADRDPRRARSRRRLLDAATHLLLSGGAAAVTVEAVTSRSGVARTTLYRNFSSAGGLLAAAFEELLPRVVDVSGATVRDRLLDLSHRQYALFLDAPLQKSLVTWLAMGVPGQSGDELGELRARVVESYLRPLRTLFAEAVAQELLDGDDVDFAVARLVGPLVTTRLAGLPPLTGAHVERIVDSILEAGRG